MGEGAEVQEGMSEKGKNAERNEASQEFRNFIAWQCRVRQEAMRSGEGKPSEGMVAHLLMPERCRGMGVVFLIHREDADEYVSQFRFIVQSCFDPRERRERGLKVLSSTYYQNSPLFREVATMVFPKDSEVAEALCEARKVRFLCRGGGHAFEATGRVEEVGEGDELREGSLWHNRLFANQGEQIVVAVWIEGVVRKE